MFELKNLNVHRIVASEDERDQLIANGFTFVGEVTPDFTAMTVAELKAYAEGKNVDLTGLTKKEDIIAKLKAGK